MVSVELFLAGDNSIRGFQLAGHADAAPYGEDLVCGAISILGQTAVIGLEHFLSEAPLVKIQAGFLRCILPPGLKAKEQAQAQVILKTMELGLQALEPNYGEYFKLQKRRWTECV